MHGQDKLICAERQAKRVIGANVSVATAKITDISLEAKRARRFGLFNAVFYALTVPLVLGLGLTTPERAPAS
ncbi:hypothetical protein [Rhizobium bangladeshense]|uniref:hypothetical protein n=1 Tax=Rhizobium bangladeshense TaxID=1138189 RepID=UPI0007E5715E|nr:hypothetical protein [Rhizobium bangladeshense]